MHFMPFKTHLFLDEKFVPIKFVNLGLNFVNFADFFGMSKSFYFLLC